MGDALVFAAGGVGVFRLGEPSPVGLLNNEVPADCMPSPPPNSYAEKKKKRKEFEYVGKGRSGDSH